MKVLLIVPNARDIFVYNMAKWLKIKMSIDIDVFEYFTNNRQGNDYSPYNKVGFIDSFPQFCKTRIIRTFCKPIYRSYKLKQFLKNEQYDIIHCHWITQETVLSSFFIKKYCKQLFITFWGGERDKANLFYSHHLYLFFLKKLLNRTDFIVNAPASIELNKRLFPSYKGNYHIGRFGSKPLENLYNIMKIESKNSSKSFWGILSKKTTILIGYSGKIIHNHIKIIKELAKGIEIKEQVHLLVPMTRGGDPIYTKNVENQIISAGFSYTLIKDRFLSDEEIARLRNATDITLQYSDFDAFSYSIFECICARSLVIYGDWLNYDQYLSDLNLKAIKTKSITEGVAIINDFLTNPKPYFSFINSNFENGIKKGLWQYCIMHWVDAYKKSCPNVEVY